MIIILTLLIRGKRWTTDSNDVGSACALGLREKQILTCHLVQISCYMKRSLKKWLQNCFTFLFLILAYVSTYIYHHRK